MGKLSLITSRLQIGHERCTLTRKQWVDRKTGIAAILFAHLMPFGDPVIARIYDQLETVVYEIVGQKA